MTHAMTSRQRMLAALRRQPVDHVPCAMMSFSAMRGRCQDAYEVSLREREMGMDSMLFIPSSWRNERPNHPDLRGLPVRLPAEVRVDLWQEHPAGERFPLLHKVYHTPVGELRVAVRRTDDWPHGSAVPLVEDYQIPRAIKPLIAGPEDLAPLRFLLRPPDAEAIAGYRREVRRAHAFRDVHGVLLAGGWGVAADMVGWLCGLERMALLTMDQPAFLQELLALIAAWNEARMRVVLEGGVDLFIRRGWYETADFWSPALHRQFLLPQLRREVEIAHGHGALFGYVMTTGALPMLDNIRDAGVDVLIGVDPLQRQETLETMRGALGGAVGAAVCLWGGVNGAITVEEGSEEEVRRAVGHALAVMEGAPGFVLSPVDNITDVSPRTWRNMAVFVDAWREHWT
jgi:uroporphyrinogen-III decarboxylase